MTRRRNRRSPGKYCVLVPQVSLVGKGAWRAGETLPEGVFTQDQLRDLEAIGAIAEYLGEETEPEATEVEGEEADGDWPD